MVDIERLKKLFIKYHQKGGRYSYFPSRNNWRGAPSLDEVTSHFAEYGQKKLPTQLYVHIPFCESLCTFCGLNINVTKNHEVTKSYLSALVKEFLFYQKISSGLNIKSIYLGGGTPTYLAPTEIDELLTQLTKNNPEAEIILEAHPHGFNLDLIPVLKKFNTSHIQFGIQDFNEEISHFYNRHFNFEHTVELFKELKSSLPKVELGVDLIYGLISQEEKDIQVTERRLRELSPTRISLYPYTIPPWQHAAHNSDENLSEKYELKTKLVKTILEQNYFHLGQGHYSKETGRLYIAKKEKRIFRNLTTFNDHVTDILLGLGVSSMSTTPDLLFQNHKILPTYQHHISKDEQAIHFGHVLTSNDKELAVELKKLFSYGEFALHDFNGQKLLNELMNDGILIKDGNHVAITEIGLYFIKEIGRSIDPYINPVS